MKLYSLARLYGQAWCSEAVIVVESIRQPGHVLTRHRSVAFRSKIWRDLIGWPLPGPLSAGTQEGVAAGCPRDRGGLEDRVLVAGGAVPRTPRDFL